MTIVWRRDGECECGDSGCFATADVLLPDWTTAFIDTRAALLARTSRGGVHSPQDPRR